MAEKKAPLIKVRTERGTARFPSLNKPDTKYNPEGEFKIGVIMSQEDAQPIIDKATAEAEKIFASTKEALQESVKTLKGEKLVKAKKALAELAMGDMPFKPIYDDDGNETGDVVLNFKMKASRKDKKTGATIKMVPQLFDASGKPIKAFDSKKNPLENAPQVWGGSIVKVSGSLNPFYIPGTNTCGVGFRLAAVQIIELRSGGGGDAASYGFGKEEGYEAGDDEPADDSGDNSSGEEGLDEDVDF